ncbi:MAG: hypothetical protein KIS66_05705 [Fimbriimonadaceae bacterium]|nr:hypothetical protein [Fimbriimonadaceae bacterium]
MITLTLELHDAAAEDLAAAYRAEDPAAFVRDHVARFLRDDLRRIRREMAIGAAESAFEASYDPGDEVVAEIAA